ncbi:MAG: MarP family serine protease [Mycobacteriales bacterium]
MHGDLLDLVLVALAAAAAASGFRQGFVGGLLSFVGVIGGGYVGTRIAPAVARHLTNVSTPVVGIVVVFALAAVGQAVAAGVGTALRRRLTWRPLRTVDSAGGAVLSVVALLVVVWLLATAVAHSTLTGLAREVKRSAVIEWVDRAMPAFARSDLASFRRLLDNTGFPAIVGPLSTENVASVPPPDPAVLGSAAVARSKGSIVKVRGDAPGCSRRVEGSGFVISPQRVLTNAHVVAGVRSPDVFLPDGTALPARVVLYDPNRDLAVLDVPGLTAKPLTFGVTADRGASAVVAGYPEDGGFTAVAARIRDRQDIRGPNIYQSATVTRDVYAVRASVLPGNSGGPLLATDGTVYGVVFAASTDTADTGYALTAQEAAPDVAAGRSATRQVSTQGCD